MSRNSTANCPLQQRIQPIPNTPCLSYLPGARSSDGLQGRTTRALHMEKFVVGRFASRWFRWFFRLHIHPFLCVNTKLEADGMLKRTCKFQNTDPYTLSTSRIPNGHITTTNDSASTISPETNGRPRFS